MQWCTLENLPAASIPPSRREPDVAFVQPNTTDPRLLLATTVSPSSSNKWALKGASSIMQPHMPQTRRQLAPSCENGTHGSFAEQCRRSYCRQGDASRLRSAVQDQI